MATTEFEDLKIVALDDKLSTQPDKKKAEYKMHLRLSKTALNPWVQLFNKNWADPYMFHYNRKAKATSNGSHIIVECVPEDLGVHHLGKLKEAVAATNNGYRQMIADDAEAAAVKEMAERIEKERLAEVKASLNFD